jgi:asparagine synthase (glutamine-hydrolysing)
MCGFAGFLDLSGEASNETLARTAGAMAKMLVHRGPDAGGTWTDGAAGVALGHRRLSIIDLSAEGHQPMESACGRYVIVYNGEIYNFPEIRKDLQAGGCGFRGHSDTEVLLAAVAAWGLQPALEKFVGMFAFALWDRETRSLALVRDRLGEKPLYYGWAGSVLLFGSELKTFRPNPAWDPEIDRGALTLFLRHGYVPAPYCIYRGIRKLPPGHLVRFGTFTAGYLPEPVAYWSMRTVTSRGVAAPFVGSERDAADELETLLRQSIREQMVADVPVGAFLSGGVDSSTVVALMQAEGSRPVKTFSIGLLESEHNEAEHARAVAQHLGTEHTELFVTADQALSVIPLLPTLYDEPFADSSQIPTFLVAQLARQQVTVSLSGDGGDELFGGYPRYTAAPRLWKLLDKVPASMLKQFGRMLGSGLLGRWSSTPHGEKIARVAEVLAAGNPDALHRALLSTWVQPESVVGVLEPPTCFVGADRHPCVAAITERMMYLDTISYLPDDLLVKVDRAAMGVSLETRIPLLDHRVVEFAWSLPLSMKIREGETKWLLRQVLYRHVPRELIERPKMGFGIPMGEWLRGPLRDWADALLDEERIRRDGFFDPAPIRERWRQHLRGEHNWQYPLWCVLMFNAWLCQTGGEDASTGSVGNWRGRVAESAF